VKRKIFSTKASSLTAVAFIAAVGLTGCQSVSADVKPYAAIVDGHVISNDLINNEIQTIINNPRYSQLLDQELSAGSGAGGLQPDGRNTVSSTYTAQLVYNRVLVQLTNEALAKQHLTISAADRASANTSVRSDINDDALFNSLPRDYQDYLIDRQASLNAVLDQRDTPAKQQQYYNQNPSQFATYCIRHILVSSQQQAQSLYSQLQSGADFATLAKANSIDTGSAPQGGDLGCQSGSDISQYVQPFPQTVFAATPGVVNAPVQSQYGWHIIEVTSKTMQSFAQAQPTISQTLGSSQEFFTDALATAKVKVNPRYGDYVPSDASSGEVGHIIPHPAATVGASSSTPSQ
jgi:hypothetical protein